VGRGGLVGVTGFIGGIEDEGFADDFAPGSLEGFAEFFLGGFLGLEEELAEIGEGEDGFGLEVAQGGGAEERGEAGSEIRSSESVVVKILGDEGAGLFGFDLMPVFVGVVIAEAHVSGKAGHGAAAAIGEIEDTTIGFILGDGHRNLLKS